MAVLGRLLLGSAERLDLPDLLSIDSFTAADFKYLIQSFIGSDKPFILKGFDVIQPQDSIDAESISIRVADSVVYYPVSGAGSFYFGLPEGTIGTEPLVPELRKNATNFVYLTFSTFDTARDSRAFWDPDQNGGEGGEFSQDVNTQSALSVEVNVSVSTFPEDVIPIAKVKVGPSAIESIQDCRDMMFRLGSGGVSPDPFNTFSFRDEPNSAYSRTEPSTIMTSSLDPNPFQGGDKNIFTLKEWMDVVMTRIKEISGDTYWYFLEGTGGGYNVADTWHDALGSSVVSKGSFYHDELVGGRMIWDESICFRYLTDPRCVIMRPSTVDIAEDNQVAYIKLIRDEDINTTATAVTWLNGSDIVNGVVGSFENLTKGDWIKKKSDQHSRYLRAEEFYASPNLAGGTTSPALAQSVKLNGNYAGTSATDLAEYTKGEYLQTDVQVRDRGEEAVHDIGGDFFWLGYRADIACDIESITPTELTIDITQADGVKARVTSAGHGLIDQDRITITTGGYAGTHQVEVEDADNFFINTPKTGDEFGQAAFYAIVETRAVSTQFGYELESENHTAKANQRVFIESTGSLYDGSYLCNPRTDTTLQIPYNALTPDPATPADSGQRLRVVKINVKTQFGIVKVIQGESIDIGDVDTQNILSYIGMDSLSQTAPIYNTPSNYNALDGFQNYNCDEDDDLTTRAAKLTAMMADRVQERGFSFRGRVNITSVTNGLNQDISANGSLTLHKPSSPEQIIDLTCSIPINSVAIANIDRDSGSAITLTVESLGNNFLLGENKYIMFYRFNDTTVYTWQDQELRPNGHINFGLEEDSSNRNIVVYNPGSLILDAVSGLLILDVKEGAEKTRIITPDGATVPQSSWYTLNSALDVNEYYVWYDVDAGGIDPAVAGKTGIQVSIASANSADVVALATETAINLVASVDMTAAATGDQVVITNNIVGDAANCLDTGNTGFNIAVLCDGNDPDIELVIPGSTNKNIIDVDAINGLGTLIMPDGASAWIRVNRFAEKTFNTVLTADAPDTDANGAIYITAIEDVPVDQDVFVLWTRISDNIIESNKAQRPDGNVYEEALTVVSGVPTLESEITGPLPANTELQLPFDSRDAGNIQEYIVGSGQLEIHLRGKKLISGLDFIEIGTPGCLSSRVRITRPLLVTDVIVFSIRTQGSVYFASDGTLSTSLQGAYDSGRFINVITGQPIVITGAFGKLVSIQGDMDVTGVIDPKGITFDLQSSSPLASQSGIWFNDSDEMMVEAVAGTSVINTATGDLVLKSATSKTIIDAVLEMGKQVNLNGQLLTDLVGSITLGSNLDVKGNLLLSSVGDLTLGSNIDTNGFNVLDGGTLFIHKTGTENIFAGVEAGNSSLTGAQNSGFGFSALNAVTSGAHNSIVGASAGALIEDGTQNTSVGSGSLSSVISSSDNTALGYQAGLSITTGENSVFIGSGANTSAPTLDNQIALGFGAVVDAANKMRIGNDDLTSIELAPNSTLRTASGTFSTESAGDLFLNSIGGNANLSASSELILTGGTSTITANSTNTAVTNANIFLTGLVTMSSAASIGGALNMNNNKIANVAKPTLAADAARKEDVDNAIFGAVSKRAVRAATTGALPAVTYNNGIAGTGATLTADANGALIDIDTVTLALNDRVLVKDQAAAVQNGIYTVTSLGDGSSPFVLTRSEDLDGSFALEVQGGASTFVTEGAENLHTVFRITGTGNKTVGTDSIDWVIWALRSLLDDTAPTLGGNLTLGNNKILHGANGMQRGPSASEFLEEEYVHDITLTGSQTNDNSVTSLWLAVVDFEGMIVDYKIKDTISGDVRVGQLFVAADGSTASVADTFSETGNVGVSWDAVVNGPNVEIRYTTTVGDKTMRCDLKRIKA